MAANSGKYFDYNGTRYYTGTVFECHDFLSSNPEENIVNFKFLDIMGDKSKCRIQRQGEWCNNICSINDFTNSIIRVVENPEKVVLNRQNEKYKNDKYYHYIKDGEDFYTYKDEDYYIGWIVYIAAMLFVTIFNGRVAAWIFISIIFFSWKNKKLKG